MDNHILELIPLGFAIRDTMGTDREHIAPSLDVNTTWIYNRQVAELYRQWQSLPDQEHRWEWVAEKIATDPLIVEAIEAANTGIIYPRDAVVEIKANYQRTEEARLLQILTTETEGKKKVTALDRLQSLYGSTDSKAVEISLADPPHKNECMLCREDIPLLPRCEITAIKAKAKSGKTHLGQWWAAAAIGSVGKFTRPDDAPPRRVLFIDTEQSTYSSYKVKRNISRMAGLDDRSDSPYLTVFNLRSLHTDQRLPFLLGQVATGKYDLVILDGIKDLTKDINDNQEADRVLNDLTSMVETYNIALLTVLHENPSKDADKMRGHLGTELLNKAFDVFEISLDRDAGVFNILHTDSRDKPVPLWAFRFNDDDELEECEPTKKGEGSGSGPQGETKEEKELRQFRQFSKAWEKDPTLSLTQEEIIQALLKIDMSETTIKRRVKAYEAKKKIKSYDSSYDNGQPCKRYELIDKSGLYFDQEQGPNPPF